MRHIVPLIPAIITIIIFILLAGRVLPVSGVTHSWLENDGRLDRGAIVLQLTTEEVHIHCSSRWSLLCWSRYRAKQRLLKWCAAMLGLPPNCCTLAVA
jgi:hypothetical protein